jgi:hypothetical protein
MKFFLILIFLFSTKICAEVGLGSCLEAVFKATQKNQITPCFFDSMQGPKSEQKRKYIQETDLTTDEQKNLSRLIKSLKTSRDPFRTGFKILRNIRLNPEKYSSGFQILLMRKIGRSKKLSSALIDAGKLLNKINLQSKIYGNNPRLSIKTSSSGVKRSLDLMETKLSRMKDQTFDGFLGIDRFVMRAQDRAKSQVLIDKIKRISKEIQRTDNPSILKRYYLKLEEVEKEYKKIDKDSLGGAEDFQSTAGAIKNGVDVIGALSQTAAVQIATLKGGAAGGAAMAAGFCIFQKEYERYANGDMGQSSDAQFHRDVAASCAIDGAVSGISGKLSIKAFDKIDARVAKKAYASTLKVLSGSGISMASSISSTVMTNMFAETASNIPDASICQVVAQSIKSEIDQYSTPKGLATLLLQNLIFKGLHKKSKGDLNLRGPSPVLPSGSLSATSLPKLRFSSLDDFHRSRKALMGEILSRRKQRTKKEINQKVMKDAGITENDYVYRWVDPQFLDGKKIRGNQKSVPKLIDTHNNDVNINTFSELGEHQLEGVKYIIDSKIKTTHSEKIVDAWELKDPGLNVSAKISDSYKGDGKVLIKFKVKDALRYGGRVYRDISANDQRIKPIYITVPNNNAVPIEFVDR